MRAPVALDRMTVAEEGSVLYRADSVHPRHRANFRAFRAFRDPREFIAALVPHIAGVHERTTLYHGFRSNRSLSGDLPRRARSMPARLRRVAQTTANR